ncbi:MAG: hypothetical protein KAX39_02895 [candidate division Zixibacteria bacterium]|nr:hypothetical protein [candidate division Zixibacteria bacterium]
MLFYLDFTDSLARDSQRNRFNSIGFIDSLHTPLKEDFLLTVFAPARSPVSVL